MKIGLIITKAEVGGAQAHVLELIDGLLHAGHEASLAAGAHGWLAAECEERGLDVSIIPDLVHPIRPLRDVVAVGQVRRWIQCVRPDILHAHSSKAGLVGRLAAFSLGVPSVYTAHGWAFSGGSAFVRKVAAIPSEWVAAKTGGDIICVSEYDRALARRLRIASAARLHMVWNGIEDVASRANPGADGVPVITMVARFAPPKDYENLLLAMALIVNLPWRLRLVGDGPLLSGARDLAASLGISDRVDFLGRRSDVENLLASSTIFVLSSRFEGLPISILEAMRAGLPIVASDVGGIPELIDERNGFLVPAGDSERFASALSELIGDSDLRVRMGTFGRSRYESDFRAISMIEKTIAIYGACLVRAGACK